MAKRDKLYTVNKWNKPFFEEERKKKLYGNGGPSDSNRIIYGLNNNQGWKTFGYYNQEYNPTLNVSQLTKQKQENPTVTDWFMHTNQPEYHPQERVSVTPMPGQWDAIKAKYTDDDSSTEKVSNSYKVPDYISDFLPIASKAAKNVISAKKAYDFYKSTSLAPAATTTAVTKQLSQPIATFANTATSAYAPSMANYVGAAVSDPMKNAVLASSQKLANSLMAAKPIGNGITPTGWAGINAAAGLAGEGLRYAVSGKKRTGVGNAIDMVGNAAATLTPLLISNPAGWLGGAILLGAKSLATAADKLFYSKYNDNGATAFKNMISGLDANGSDEYLASLRPYTGTGIYATSENSPLNHSGERKANKTNDLVAQAQSDLERSIENGLRNNLNTRHMDALSNYFNTGNYTAMGGKLNKCKCNKKAIGGILNNTYINPVTPTGYGALQDMIAAQTIKNQSQQDAGASVGNSFMGDNSVGTILAEGGNKRKTNNPRPITTGGAGYVPSYNENVVPGLISHAYTPMGAATNQKSNAWGPISTAVNIGSTLLPALSGSMGLIGAPFGLMLQSSFNERETRALHDYIQRKKNGKPTTKAEDNAYQWYVEHPYVLKAREDDYKQMNKKSYGGKLGKTKDKDIRNNNLVGRAAFFDLGGILQAGGSNWGHTTVIGAGGQHETNPHEGVQVGVDPEGTPNLVEEGEVIWNDYVFSDRIKVPKEVCKRLRIGMKKNGFTFAEAAKKLLKESEERPNDPISKKALDANMQLLEDAQEEVKRKMDAERAVEEFNSLPPEQQVAIMQQEGERAQDAVTQQQMAEQIQNMPPEQQQAIAQQMMAEQAAAQQGGMPQQGMSPEEQYAMQQQAMQDQMAQQQYQQDRAVYNQQALEQAAAMQAQAINQSAYGGRLFAEGGELFDEESQQIGISAQQNQNSAEYDEESQQNGISANEDTEMAKYSDEELQDMIEDYQEAESGEVKVTKGKLARLRKKAEKAQRELERRHSEENEEQPQEGQEVQQQPTQEEIEAAAQAQAQQVQQPIGMPQGEMSPEQAMMMQQMGSQMSPEQMAAQELQQQESQQYAYGGNLYERGGRLTGLELLSLLGFDNYQDAAAAGFKDPSVFGLADWNDELGDNFTWDNKWLNNKGISPEIKYAIENNLYNPVQLLLNEESAPWFEPTAGNGPYDWTSFHAEGKGKKLTGKESVKKEEVKALKDAYKYTLKDLEYTDDLTLEKVDEIMKASDDWQRTQNWLFKDKNAANNRLKYMSDIVMRNLNDDGSIKEGFSPQKIYDFTSDDKGGFNVKRKDKVSEADEIAFWNNVQSDYKYGDMYNTYHIPQLKTRYFVKDKDGKYKEYFNEPVGLKQIGSDLSSYIYGDNETADKLDASGYNQTVKFYEEADSPSSSTSNNKVDESKLRAIRTKSSPDLTGLGLSIAGPLTGLFAQIARGKPDTSELTAAAGYAPTLEQPHTPHGLMDYNPIDPRIGDNDMRQASNAAARILQNTGAAPSQGANILMSDQNHLIQRGKQRIDELKYNDQRRNEATQWNGQMSKWTADALTGTDSRNTAIMNDAAKYAAQMNYNTAKEKLDQDNAWWGSILGNGAEAIKSLYGYWRERRAREDRDRLASILFPMNDDYAQEYGVSYVNPEGLVVRGINSGKYYRNNYGKHEFSNTPFAANGGKLKKKRRGYTF